MAYRQILDVLIFTLHNLKKNEIMKVLINCHSTLYFILLYTFKFFAVVILFKVAPYRKDERHKERYSPDQKQTFSTEQILFVFFVFFLIAGKTFTVYTVVAYEIAY